MADAAAVDAELARDDTASGRRHQARCLAARPSAEVKEQAWARVVESDVLSNALVEATIAGFAQFGQRELLAPYLPRYFAAIERVWRERSIEIGMEVVRGLFPAWLVEQATLDAATTERTLLLAEFYRRNAGWRLRILGLGYDHGLATLARDYGVDVEDD